MCLIYVSSVGGTGAPARHSWTRKRGSSSGAASPPRPPTGSGDARWGVNLSNTTETGAPHTHQRLLCRWVEKNRRWEGMSVRSRATAKSGAWGTFWSHVYIHVLQDKYGSFKNICTNLTLWRVEAHWQTCGTLTLFTLVINRAHTCRQTQHTPQSITRDIWPILSGLPPGTNYKLRKLN